MPASCCLFDHIWPGKESDWKPKNSKEEKTDSPNDYSYFENAVSGTKEDRNRRKRLVKWGTNKTKKIDF